MISTRYTNFLETLLEGAQSDSDKNFIRTAILGFDCLANRRNANNPFAQEETLDKADPIYDADKFKRRPKMDLDPYNQDLLDSLMNKFNIDLDEVRDHYIADGFTKTIKDWLETKLNDTKWDSRIYFDDDENEFYGKVKKGTEVPIKNRYQNNNGAGD